ncbi:MAG: hypothetical protein QM656_14220 [Paracoccaceae bacterium]
MTVALSRRAVVAGVAAFGAGGAQARGTDVTGEYREGDLGLETAWDQGEGRVRCRYRLVNGGGARLVVFDRLYHTASSGKRRIDEDQCWRWLEEGGLYRMAKTVPSVPGDMRVEMPEVPYARLLLPGAVLEGQAVAPVPLDQLLPYEQAPAHTAREITRIVLTLGFAVADGAMEAREIEEGILSLRYGWAEPRQKVVSCVPVGADLPMSGAPED